jgi:translocation protein SEC63
MLNWCFKRFQQSIWICVHEIEKKEGVQLGEIVTMCAWITLQHSNGLVTTFPHAPHFLYFKDEFNWLLLVDTNLNFV